MAIYNVKNFGARGNGYTDDRLAIQAAIDAAGKAGGGTVIIPKGVFIVSPASTGANGCLVMRNNVTLEGSGMGETSIKLMDHSDQKVTGIIRTRSGEISHDIAINNLTIDGNKTNQNPASANETDGFFCGVTPTQPQYDYNISLDRIEIKNVTRYGFDPHEQTKNLSITNSVAHHNGKDGFTIDYIFASRFENNVSYSNGRHGFNVVTSSHDLVLTNNVAYDNASEGLVVQRGSEDRPLTDDIMIQGGKYYDNGSNGVLVKISTDVIVTGAIVYGNASHGISVEGSVGSRITDNLVFNNAQADEQSQIHIASYDDRLGAAKKIFAATDNIVSHNFIYNATDHKSYYSIEEVDSSSLHNAIYDNRSSGSLKGEINVVNASVSANGPAAGLEWREFLTWGKAPDPTDPRPPVTDSPGVELEELRLGNSGNNVMGGSAALNDHIDGAGGNDRISGNGGHDWLLGQDGNDVLLGSEGNDTLAGGAGSDRLDGNVGDDGLDGGEGNDVIYAGDGKDSIEAGDGNDRIAGDAGADRIVGDAGNDTIAAGTDADTVNAGADSDLIYGQDGDDVLFGSADADTIYGGAGDDTLAGGLGDDLLGGNAGADTFVFAAGSGGDRIFDFQSGTDKLDLTAFEFGDYSAYDAAVHMTRLVNGYIELDFGDGDMLSVGTSRLSHSDLLL